MLHQWVALCFCNNLDCSTSTAVWSSGLRVQTQVIFYFVVLHLLHFFGLEALTYALKPDLEWLLGRLTGAKLAARHPPSALVCLQAESVLTDLADSLMRLHSTCINFMHMFVQS